MLAIVGAVLICLSLLALAYVLWPLGSTTFQTPLPPELFRPPG